MLTLTRSLIRHNGLRQGLQMASASRGLNMRVVSSPEKEEAYDERNLRLKREMSPHLTIYRPQLTSMLSISFRATGAVVSVYAWSLGLGALMSSHDISHYVTMLDGLNMGFITWASLKFIIAFPMVYHTCNGIRHLAWDSGRFLNIKEVYQTGWAMLGSSVALSLLLACL